MDELKRRLTKADRLDVSRYQFINMERLQMAAGPAWPDMRGRIFLATQGMIERRVAEEDLIIPCATGFLVIFKAMSGKLAEDTTRRIREEMEQFFLGDPELADLGVEAFSEQLSIAEFEAALAAADLEFVDEDPVTAPTAEREVADTPTWQLRFFPVWDTQMEAAASYFVEPCSDNGNAHGWQTPLLKPDRPDARLEFDLDVLEHAVRALEQLVSTGSKCALITPVGFASASLPRTRASYVTALSKLPDSLRQLIWVRLEGAPSNAPASIMGETGRILRAQAPHLYVDASLASVSLDSQSETGAGFVGCSLTADRVSAQRADLDRISALARRKKVTAYLDGVHRFEDLQVAINSGMRLISGRSVGEFDEPRAPFRLTAQALLSRAA